MRESSTYQMILREGVEIGLEQGREKGLEQGRHEEAIRALFLVGTPRLGEPEAAARERVERETERARIEGWLGRLMTVESWSELLADGA